jgi:hypothetical protein
MRTLFRRIAHELRATFFGPYVSLKIAGAPEAGEYLKKNVYKAAEMMSRTVASSRFAK